MGNVKDTNQHATLGILESDVPLSKPREARVSLVKLIT